MTSIARRREHDSGEYSDVSHHEIDHDNSGNEGGQPESDYESQGSESDRSDRDTENQETERRVDDDEDRSNPQYIPKRGTFYEHDDRTAASGEESSNTTSETTSEKKEGSETPAERRRAPRKSETINKWSHDKYNENEQMPKSRDELVSIYGYDIRNEDAPPHARRNRRYGRGPNKYTRTWEDEEAYKRQAAAPVPNRKPPNPEDFPELDVGAKMNKRRPMRPRSKSQPSSNESLENGSQLRRNASTKGKKAPPPRQNNGPKYAPKGPPKEKMPPLENLTITATVFNNSGSQGQQQRKVNASVAQQRPVPTEQGKKKPPPQSQPSSQNNTSRNKSPPQQKPPAQQQQQKQQNQQQQAPAGGESRGGSKRYSSLRQRPLDTYSPPQQQQNQQHAAGQPQAQQHRFRPEYPAAATPAAQHQGSPAPQLHPQQMMQQIHRNAPVNQPQHGPSPPHQPLPQQQLQQPLPQQPHPQQQLPQPQLPQPQLPQPQLPQQPLQQQQLPQQPLPQQQMPQQPMPQQPMPQQHTQQVRLGILDQQQLVSHPHHTIHNMPQPHAIGQLQPTQAYAPPAMMPAQYMQQTVNPAGFGAAPIYAQPPPAPYPHPQLYQHHNYATQAGGVTYYSCAEQEQLPRAQRRPTAAIPIVRPAAPERPVNSSEKDNIDRIVENMFVRKPWPAAHGADLTKEKQAETRNSQEPPSKDSSQPNSLTSSIISTDSKPSEGREEKEEPKPKEIIEETQTEKERKEEIEPQPQESIPDA